MLARCGGRFAEFLDAAPDEAKIAALRAAETIGRPLGGPAFLDAVATIVGRDPRPAKRGRKKQVRAPTPAKAKAFRKR